ncbi:sensor histidine kinase [Pedobacter mucosus]|uniref:sensor histidine kinase n=1 Tax=Pedobacter mucosus TaxID=2895286 RepID=UPI001EE48B8A|nr:sensor histidine kinase [Pedobacter mucosus]UKT65007.1 sensor histidine kinase [Pedobacter mucosus]
MKPNTWILQLTQVEWKPLMIILGLYSFWWLAVTAGLISLQGLQVTIRQFGSEGQLYGGLVHSILKGTLTYYILIFWFAIPFVRKQNRRKIIFRYFIFLAFLTGYEYCWDFEIGTPPPGMNPGFPLGFYFLVSLTADFLMAVISIFVATWIESGDALRRESDLEKQKLNAELSAIKYQINPHFLFNSLSFIYTKTVKQNPEAAHAVHLLSEIMSYALEEWGELGRVPLALEIAQIKKVIEMNRIRFNNKLNLQYTEYVEPGGGQVLTSAHIPTLAFITLVENAFKHADLQDEKNGVLIQLQVTPSRISFSVGNKKRKGAKEPSHGIGLSNVTQRLQLMFGSGHSFAIIEDDKNYLTEIQIELIKPS